MALSLSTIFEIRTGGSDTLNSGLFDPGKVASGGFADYAIASANTSAPVVTSASYTFVAGDVGAQFYLDSGTNSLPGWYPIVSVSAGAATLNAAIGAAVTPRATSQPWTAIPSTVLGCASSGSSLTSCKGAIDFSQQDAAHVAYTDLLSAGTGLTVSSAAKPFGRQQVGNAIVITGGTNFNTGRYVIASVAAVTFIATVVGPTNITTGAGASGTGGLGGAWASPGACSALVTIGQVTVWQKAGTYSITSASANVAGGCVNPTAQNVRWEGYQTTRGDLGTAPLLQASGISTATLFTNTNGQVHVRNLTFDGASLTSIRGATDAGSSYYYRCKAMNCTNTGLFGVASTIFHQCSATGCATTGSAIKAHCAIECVAYANSVPGFLTLTSGAHYERCLSYGNTGASSHGFSLTSGQTIASNCVAYGNGGAGFLSTITGNVCAWCLAEGNTGYGFSNTNAASVPAFLYQCGTFGNTAGPTDSGFVNGTLVAGASSLFTNAASGDFSLNATASAGAAARGITLLFPVGLTTGKPDMGAAQHADPVSTGGTGFFIQ